MKFPCPVPGQALADAALLLARLLLALIFLHEGMTLATHFAGALAAFAKLGLALPVLILTIGVQIIAGLSVATGCFTRIGALALGGFCLATALQIHTNFAVQNELLHFEKDLAIAGGLLALAVTGPGRLALDRCGQGGPAWLRALRR